MRSVPGLTIPPKKMINLANNENSYGCSRLALKAVLKKYKDICSYPELNPIALKEKLAEQFGVTAKNIVAGAGSVKIIDGLIKTFVGQDEEVITFEKSFIAYEQLSDMHGKKCHFAPLTELCCAPENILPFITEKTRLIIIANPNNPTGTIISHDELDVFLRRVPEHITVAIDEAYAEYVTDPAFPNSIELLRKYRNVVILRSFSKVYGLAGLRIGYGIMEEGKAEQMAAGQIPFSLNYLSYNAAIAALQDRSFVEKSVIANAGQRKFLERELTNLGFNTIPSQANFIYLWFAHEGEKREMYDLLFQNGIMICDLKKFKQEKALRITIGERNVNQKIISLIKHTLALHVVEPGMPLSV